MSYMRNGRYRIIVESKGEAMQQLARDMRRQPTKEEAHLWYRLRAGRLNGLHFRRQQIIEGYIVDFYCHAAGLVIELDGSVHSDTVPHDRERDLILSRRGLTILRFRNDEVFHDTSLVLNEIELAARRCLREDSSSDN